MQKIIILDHSTGEVHIFDYDSNKFDNYENFYLVVNEETGLHFTDSQCSCMISSEPSLTITHH